MLQTSTIYDYKGLHLLKRYLKRVFRIYYYYCYTCPLETFKLGYTAKLKPVLDIHSNFRFCS